jgi:hypothetical protein
MVSPPPQLVSMQSEKAKPAIGISVRFMGFRFGEQNKLKV